MRGEALSGANAAPLPPPLLAFARSGWTSVTAPCTRWPGAWVAGSAIESAPSPAVAVTVAVVDAV